MSKKNKYAFLNCTENTYIKEEQARKCRRRGRKKVTSMHLICIRHSTLQNCTCIPIRN